jgi:HlyD family secretion protein
VYEAVPVERRDIHVSAEAAGTIEPDITVEVKSKASGEILEVRVETGDRVEQGTLMVRIDQRQPRNTLAQAEAELEVAQARQANATAELRRAEKLLKAESISEATYDEALLDQANSKAEVVRGRVAVENARIALDDTDVLAPITGTVIERNVERGQVISSPIQDVSGGTLLLRMADLKLVRARTLVDETDIGKLRPGLEATITVGAYPERPFRGSLLKIEPQSVTEQNVTMFPVLLSVDNRDGSLLPGMNCEAALHIERRENVLAVPNAALRTPRDVASAARLLGLSEPEIPRADGPPPDGEPSAQRGKSAPAGRYLVFVLRDGHPVPVRIETGLTDLDYTEVLSGLREGDSVLVLPSASLTRSQERFKARVDRLTGGGLPGVRRSKQ